MSERSPPPIAWYGKLPSRGDFVGRGLPRAWLRTWDDWLQRGLASAAQRLGAEELRERLLDMPLWSCLVLPLQPGQPAWCGIVSISSDRVGRAFPLLLAEACDEAALEHVALAELRSRAECLARWLHQARSLSSPREFETSAAQLAAPPWAREPNVDPSAKDTFAIVRARWPQATSFWWLADPGADMRTPLAEAWPPRETLILDWLGAAS